MFESYDKNIREILRGENNSKNWNEVLDNHREMIRIIQHERLVHLMVMIFVGIVMSMSFLATIMSEKFYMLLLDIPLLILFVGYLFHYRFLENKTQSWYKLQREIEIKIRK
jgi:uncharacterized membrane protein